MYAFSIKKLGRDISSMKTKTDRTLNLYIFAVTYEVIFNKTKLSKLFVEILKNWTVVTCYLYSCTSQQTVYLSLDLISLYETKNGLNNLSGTFITCLSTTKWLRKRMRYFDSQNKIFLLFFRCQNRILCVNTLIL